MPSFFAFFVCLFVCFCFAFLTFWIFLYVFQFFCTFFRLYNCIFTFLSQSTWYLSSKELIVELKEKMLVHFFFIFVFCFFFNIFSF